MSEIGLSHTGIPTALKRLEAAQKRKAEMERQLATSKKVLRLAVDKMVKKKRMTPEEGAALLERVEREAK